MSALSHRTKTLSQAMREWSKEGEKTDTTKERAKIGARQIKQDRMCVCVYVGWAFVCVCD